MLIIFLIHARVVHLQLVSRRFLSLPLFLFFYFITSSIRIITESKNVNVHLKLRKRFILDLSINDSQEREREKKKQIDFPELSTAVWCICCKRSVKTVVFFSWFYTHADISIFGCLSVMMQQLTYRGSPANSLLDIF